MVNPDDAYIPNLYGRRQDKPLKRRQAALMRSLLPELAAPDAAAGPIDVRSMFPHTDEIWLEVGFGGGEHLAWQAAQNPGVGIIGAENFVNGVAKLLVHVDDAALSNVRICFGDARPFMEALGDGCLSRLFLLYPDPWPKKRHAKRRMASPWFFAEAARLLKSGGTLRIATDIPDYAAFALAHARRAPQLVWRAERACDWTIRPADQPPTRYETKALKASRKPVYLAFQRI